MEADRDALLKLPEYPFPVFRYEALSVNKYGFAVKLPFPALPNLDHRCGEIVKSQPGRYSADALKDPFQPLQQDEWMELDRKLPRKQRHTAMRIYHRLVDEQGYQGSYSSVKRYVRKKKFERLKGCHCGHWNKSVAPAVPHLVLHVPFFIACRRVAELRPEPVMEHEPGKELAAEGYLPLAQPCGHGQVDFGESLYYDAQGKERKGYALTVSFPQSNKGYTQFFPSQNLLQIRVVLRLQIRQLLLAPVLLVRILLHRLEAVACPPGYFP